MRKAFLFILLIFVCILLVSCGEVDSNGLDEFEALLGETDDSSEQIEEKFAEMVYVVIPQGSSAELSAKAKALATEISAKTGVSASVKYDNESTVASDKNLEILVGYTCRLRSQEILKSFRLGEYIYCWDRGSIIVGGRDEAATLTAIDEFSRTVLHGASSTSLMGADAKFEKKIDYALDSITLNGYDLYDFTLTYSDQGKSGEQEIARTLRDYIAKKSGYLLNVIPYSSRKDDTGKIICVGDELTAASDKQLYKSFLNTVGNDVSIYGSGSYELSAAAAEFADKILPNTQNKSVEANITLHAIDNIKITPVKLCSAFFDGTRTIARITDISNKISLGGYDVISFFKMSAVDANDIKEHKGAYEYYEAVIDGEIFPILYNPDKIKNLSCESKGGSALIEFESSADGKKYSFSYSSSTDIASAGGDGYRIAVTDSQGEGKQEAVDGLDLIGTESLGGQVYVKRFYVDSLLVSDGVAREKTEQSEWSTVFCSVNVRAKYSDAFVQLKNAS